jgi:hypothetical protein
MQADPMVVYSQPPDAGERPAVSGVWNVCGLSVVSCPLSVVDLTPVKRADEQLTVELGQQKNGQTALTTDNGPLTTDH